MTMIAIMMTRIAATTGTMRLRLERRSRIVSSVVRDGESRAGATVPEIHSYRIN